MERKAKRRRIDPDKYGMILCPYCGGSGKSFSDTAGMKVCKTCSGFGLIIKTEEKKGVDGQGETVRLLR